MKKMKNTVKLFIMMTLSVGLLIYQPVYAQSSSASKTENTEQQKDQKESRKKVDKKYKKMALREAKMLEEAGWKTTGETIAKQLEETYVMKFDCYPDGSPHYIWTQTESVSMSFAIAQSIAENMAKLRIASYINSSKTTLFDSISNKLGLSAQGDASTNEVTTKMGVTLKRKDIIIPMTIYQKSGGGNCCVRVVMFYDMKAAVDSACELMLEELINISGMNQEQLENLIGMDNIRQQLAKYILRYEEIAE